MNDIQKFFRGQKVRYIYEAKKPVVEIGKEGGTITFDLPTFKYGTELIIEGSYFDLYYSSIYGSPAESKMREYSVYQLKDNKIINAHAWYGESAFELISDDRLEGERLIREYKKQYWRIS